MSLVAIVDALVEAGATPAMIAAAVRAGMASFEEKAAARELAKLEHRAKRAAQKRRERNANVAALSPNVAATLSDNPSPSPEKKVSPEPLSKTQPSSPSPNLLKGSFPEEPLPSKTPSDFAEFWEAYPAKLSKRKSQEAFAKAVKRATPAEIMAGLERSKRSDRSWRDGFIPHASTWLNGDRWLDDHGVPSLQAKPEDGSNLTAPQWRIALQMHREEGRWFDSLGPPPGEPGCRVPSELLISAVDHAA